MKHRTATATPHDPVCRDIVHTGLNVKSSDGRMTGALLPVGVPAKPGMIIKATVPCGGSVMRVKMTDQGADGIYPHEKMEVYAKGFRNQSGVAFGPAGHQMGERARRHRQRRQRSRPSAGSPTAPRSSSS